ncbi:hypothetical protein AMECASPLE_023553 [Ameca splendens]|uniref:Uncharacterized protein n=1 Tax=Ameca splendens TaxID=208324 RepID=A0ABV0XHA5_9TELE
MASLLQQTQLPKTATPSGGAVGPPATQKLPPGRDITPPNPDNFSGESAVSPKSSLVDSVEDEPPDLTQIPEEYHDPRTVFSKSKAQTLPPHRPYDLCYRPPS